LALKAEMVVLSACNTGVGEQRGSEGILGLGWALFVAGSPAQVLTQWPVNDASTAEFMAAFYAELRQGKPKGQALNAATLKLIANPKTRPPFYWAAIYLIGDYR
jgi:CHAT domain-containing protein